MTDPLFWHRIQFAFTVTYHYLFPQLTMGLALLILILKALALKRGDEHFNEAARFWIRIFGLNFAVGVVTGIPLEFQFGTNWARFSELTGGVIGQTLAMEGIFAFFLESTFLGLLVWGEKRLGPKRHFGAALALFLGSWLSGYFIIATHAFMQHPVGHVRLENGSFQLANIWTFLFNPWALAEYAHNMTGAVITGSFALASIGAYWLLKGKDHPSARISLRTGIMVGLASSLIALFPTGDLHGKVVAQHQPLTLAAMEGHYETSTHAPMVPFGIPDAENLRMHYALKIPGMLSFLSYGSFAAEVKGLKDFPREHWPDHPNLVFTTFRTMVGLGMGFIGLMSLALWMLLKGRLFHTRWMLWALTLALPLPFLANTAGWMTAELGRQPWLIYGLLRTSEGISPKVSAMAVGSSTLVFILIYLLISLLYLFLMGREIHHGPDTQH